MVIVQCWCISLKSVGVCHLSLSQIYLKFISQGPVDHYRQTFNARRTLVCNKIVDHTDVDGASPFGAAPTTSLFST